MSDYLSKFDEKLAANPSSTQPTAEFANAKATFAGLGGELAKVTAVLGDRRKGAKVEQWGKGDISQDGKMDTAIAYTRAGGHVVYIQVAIQGQLLKSAHIADGKAVDLPTFMSGLTDYVVANP